MVKRSLVAVLACCVALGFAQNVYAEGGIVQNAGKDAAKGVVKGVQQELNTGTVIEGAKQVTKGMIDGVSTAVPQMTSQVVKQSNVNRKQIGNVARTVTREAVGGAIDGSTQQMMEAIGNDGEGPLVQAMAASSEKIVAATVRGIKSEMRLDPATVEQLTAAAVRGASSEIHFRIPVWSYLLVFVLGTFSTLLTGLGLMLLYMLFQKRRAAEPVVVAPPVVAQPVIQTTRAAYSRG